MSDSSDKSKPEKSLSLDLSQLQDLTIGPDWSDSARSAESRKSKQPSRGGDSAKRPTRDRRPERPARRQDFSRSSAPRGERSDNREQGGNRREGRSGGGPRRDRGGPPPAPFKPIVEVAFYPEDAPFKALCHAMRSNCRTYELFEIARLILEKPERYVVVLHPKQGEGPQEFFISVPDGLPFTSEDQVIGHVLKHHLEKFVDTEEVEVEPPAGNFPVVNRCGVTGKLLGPPNYHRYQALVAEHHAVNVANMPFERFSSRIESVRDEATVQEWVEGMRKETRYKLKTPDELVSSFDTLESLKFYLLNKRRAEIVRTANQTRFSGKQAETMPHSVLRDSIMGWHEQQLRFPLDTANNLRGRLRRMHFTIYKRGSKGASYVCAVKRKFRTAQTRLAESLQDLIDYIEKHPNIEVSKLPEDFLGIDVSAKSIEPAQEKAPDIESVPEEEAAKIVEAHEQKRAAKAEGNTEAVAEAPAEEQPTAAAPTKPVVDHLEDPSLRQMMFDLRWLVTEGYVTEYGDGRLFAPAPMEESAPKITNVSDDSPESETSVAEESTPVAANPATQPAEPVVEKPAEKAAVEEAPTDDTDAPEEISNSVDTEEQPSQR